MVKLDQADRHLLAVAAVWAVVVVVGLPLTALVLGVAVRVFVVASGMGQ